MKVALIETKASRTDFRQAFGGEFDFDQYQLCSDPPSTGRVLKKHCDIDIDVNDYDWIILVGSDALKFFTSENSVTAYSGKVVDKKYLPIINPSMLAFKPEAKPTWERSRDSIVAYIKGQRQDTTLDSDRILGIEDSKKANKFLKDAINHPSPFFGIDSETTGLYPRDGFIQGISVCYDGETAAYISTDCFDEDTEGLLNRLLHCKLPVFHNAKFDIAFFEYHFDIDRIEEFGDTMLLHYLIDENPGNHSLKLLALHFTPFGDYEKPMYEWIENYRKSHGILKNDFNWGDIPFEVMYPYAATDALATYVLYDKFKAIFKNKKLKNVYDHILIPGCRFLIDVQDNGVPFDRDRLILGQELMQQDIDRDIEELYSYIEVQQFEKAQGKEFNPNSVIQLRSLLFDYLNLTPIKKTEKGAPSTDAETLKALSKDSDVPALILDIRQKSKIKNTYLDKIIPQLDRDSRLRTGFNLHSTTSGRLSSSGKLNMQQLPRDNPIVKGSIKAPPGRKIVAMDLTTAEVYAAAVLSGDEALMDVFREGGNFHSTIAKRVFKLDCPVEEVAELYPTQRQAAKAVTFGIMYGAGPAKISEQVTKDSGTYFSVAEATQVINEYFSTFHKLKAWIERNQQFIMDNGFIYSHFGRKRRLPNVQSKDRGIQSHAVRSGLNFLVQSVASDINLLGAIDMHNHIRQTGMDAKIFALVHDSILADVAEDQVEDYCKWLVYFVQKDRGLSIPDCPVGCDVDVGDDYSLGKFEKYISDYNI